MVSEISPTLVNGSPIAYIDVADRGLSYGHGVFETIRIAGNQPLLWQLHIARLKRGCLLLKIDLPEDIEAILHDDVMRLITLHSHNHLIVKIMVTAGLGRGYAIASDLQYQRIVALHPMHQYPQDFYKKGVEVRTCNYLLPENKVLAGIKHLNRLDQVLARAEWNREDIFEGIMLDHHGFVVEGVMTNLFGFIDGNLITPNLVNAGVRGTMRDYLLAYARRQDIKTEEVFLLEEDFCKADELFICNSIMGVLPVRKWGVHKYKVGQLIRTFQAKANQLFYGHAAV